MSLCPRSPSVFAVLGLGAMACGAPHPRGVGDDGVSSSRQAVINGEDDRKELYQLDGEELRTTIGQSAAALMWAHRISYGDDGSVELSSGTLEDQGVCEDERFANQPSAAFCSGILIDEDLVLTAGHCLGTSLAQADAACARILIVFDYQLSADGDLKELSTDSVYGCRNVAHHERMHTDDNFIDLAVLQLDRPVSVERAPVRVGTGPPTLDTKLVLGTYGAGLPLKVEEGASVVRADVGSDMFVAATDTFGGGSGGAVYDEDGMLLGHTVRGAPDWEFQDECTRSASSAEPNEQHQRVATSVRELCATSWPSLRLCNIPPRCGDGVCTSTESAGETVEECPEDCTEAECGDAFCDVTERESCEADCAAFVDVSPLWTGDPALYLEAFAASGERNADEDEDVEKSGSRLTEESCSIGRGPVAPWFLLFGALSWALSLRRATSGGRKERASTAFPSN